MNKFNVRRCALFLALVLSLLACEKSIEVPTIPEGSTLIIRSIRLLDYDESRNSSEDLWDSDGTGPDIYCIFWIDGEEQTVYQTDTVHNALPNNFYSLLEDANIEVEDPTSTIWVQIYDADSGNLLGDELMLDRSHVLTRGQVRQMTDFPFSVRTRWEFDIIP